MDFAFYTGEKKSNMHRYTPGAAGSCSSVYWKHEIMQALIKLLMWLCFGVFRNAEPSEYLDKASILLNENLYYEKTCKAF